MKDPFSILNRIEAEYVLDAATGRGDFINVLKKHLKSYVQIIGIDASEKVIAHAQKMFPENDVEIYQMDLNQLDFEDSYFDLVCMANALHHMQEPQKVLDELLRVLKPKGMFLLTEMYSGGEQTEAQMTHVLMHHWRASIDSMMGTYHRETYNREELTKLVKTMKLNKLEIVDFYHPTDNPKDARLCANLKNTCRTVMKKLDSLEDKEALTAQGEELIKRIDRVGFASARSLLITGIKPDKKAKSKEK